MEKKIANFKEKETKKGSLTVQENKSNFKYFICIKYLIIDLATKEYQFFKKDLLI